MKRKRILTRFLLYFLMFMFLIVAGCSSSSDDNNAATDTTVDRWVTVSGTVTDTLGTGVKGVKMSVKLVAGVGIDNNDDGINDITINLWNGSLNTTAFSPIVTDDYGKYSFQILGALFENYTVILTPAKKNYTFSPSERPIYIVANTESYTADFRATATTEFSQTDLKGTWRINMLRAGTENVWMRARLTIGADGAATCNSMYLSNNPLTNVCPATGFDLTFTMDGDGVITQTGDNAVEDGGHMTMNSNKDFAAGTGTNGTSYQLMIAQKEDVAVPTTPPATLPTTHYSALDVQNKRFVFHSLSVGGTNQWRYGNGSTNAAGVIAMEAEADSAGGAATTLDGWTLAIDPYGYVTRTDAAGLLSDFQGFLSAVDERTIVGTYSEGGTDYKMIVIQFNSAQPVTEMMGSSTNHLLGVAPALTPIWAHHELNITRLDTEILPDTLDLTFYLDVMYSDDWKFSLADYGQLQNLAYMNVQKIDINNAGVATIDNTVNQDGNTFFHGQLAYDGTFMVGVSTLHLLDGNDFYAIDAITH